MVLSSSSKSPSPLQGHAYASQSSADTNYQNPILYGDTLSSATSAKKTTRSEQSKYEKQREQGDYKHQVGISRTQPISYLQVSSGSSQSASTDPHNYPPEYSTSSGVQQRFRRKKNQPHGREFNTTSTQAGQRGKLMFTCSQ